MDFWQLNETYLDIGDMCVGDNLDVYGELGLQAAEIAQMDLRVAAAHLGGDDDELHVELFRVIVILSLPHSLYFLSFSFFARP